jgi:hypothetical protein
VLLLLPLFFFFLFFGFLKNDFVQHYNVLK